MDEREKQFSFTRAVLSMCAARKKANPYQFKGWTDAETQTFTTVRNTFPASTTVQESGESDAKKATGVKDTDAADAYEHILTIQNAADLEFPATDPANAPARAEFRLGLIPPDHHVPPTVPMPMPAK